MTTLLLTGGSGFVGHWIARALPPTVRLRILARPTSDLSLLERAGVPFERVTGDLLDPASVRAAVQGVESVIHAAGTISFNRAEAERVRQANLDASLILFHAALEAGVQRVVHTASIFALGHAQAGLVTPDSSFNGEQFLDIPYVGAKRDLELASREFLAEGLPLVRVYPGLCLGPEDRTHSSSGIIAEWLRGRVPALVNGGICFVDVRDAAAAHVAALLHGEVGAQYLVPGYNLTHRQFFEALAPLAGRRPPRLTVPPALATLGAAVQERLLAPPPIWRDEARLMGYRWWYDDRATLAALGLRYRPLTDTLRATLLALADEVPSVRQRLGQPITSK